MICKINIMTLYINNIYKMKQNINLFCLMNKRRRLLWKEGMACIG